MQKVAVIGRGKTGSQVIESLGERCALVLGKEELTVDTFSEVEGIIVFVPGPAVPTLIPTLLKTGLPVVWGSTGFKWPEDLQDSLAQHHATWIHGQNFSMGMQVMRKTLISISDSLAHLSKTGQHHEEQMDVRITDIHHTSKLDAPSGTAIKWQEWLDKPYPIDSKRVGDVNGIHELLVETTGERMTFRHEAKSRVIFAEGAIWALDHLKQLKQPGLYTFEQLFDTITTHAI